MDQKIKDLAKYAKNKGIPSFLLGAMNGKLITFHFESMQIKDAMQLMISGFHHVISMELERHPEYSKEYRQIYIDLSKDFDRLVKETNQKFVDFNSKANKKK